ncbi:Transcription elongation regulator [Mycena indigotica]|uniref:Transcription factor BYE1 n=1 Tax=Mycena indigotica TaxID=2126181 RepID=A0A8H6T0N1_9AGAR|nr:Transcription elongation regulator [Mycena indigotica]KAF7309785.1 Transcription elongation regulator [Mycena indigotica]
MSRTTTRTKAPPKPKMKRDSAIKTSQIYCLCHGVDDGSPMVNCGECKEWYHFSCVDLSEGTADDINVYICPLCVTKTGQRTVLLWEGPDAVEDASLPIQPRIKSPVDDDPPPSESDKDPDSDDEYMADRAKRRRARRLSISSDSEHSGSEKNSRLRKRSSPSASKKRKAPKSNQPPAKRKKQEQDDPARSFCLGKLEAVFRDIFLRYPHVPSGGEKKQEDLTETEKAQLEEDAKQFAVDLEQCVYDLYCEPDKMGRNCAGAKYKDRYRMLQFNLSKVDRTVLHKRIASGGITPKEISLMSSTDLANEQMQQSMKMVEQEALEHSILEKTAIPRAKLTHKGFEDIEDLDNVSSAAREREAELQRAEEEKRERERAARALRTRTSSMSVPPESPISATWAPVQSRVPISTISPIEATDLPFPAISELLAEPEMNLADLINIDDEPPTQDQQTSSSPKPPVSDPIQSPTIPTTGISPFASNPEPRLSFDLNSLWTAPKKEESPAHSPEPAEAEKSMDLDNDETDDKDFDMFLEEKETVVPTPDILQAAFDVLPYVWTGKISMPLDSAIPQETPVTARQVAGRPLESTSALWKTLFPSELLRIDGRVPVDKSSQFLLQTRMNSTKELIAVAFTSESPTAGGEFQVLMDFLIAKGRHGLVFPWGSRPKDHHPGKELYIIPLLSSDSLPDYMELLDNLQLPKLRTANLLVGIWVLNKGKLAAPPPPPLAVTSSVPVSTTIPPFISAMPSSIPQPAAPPPVTFEPSVLAAEVATLTPEQVRLMLQSLTSSIPNPNTAPPMSIPSQQPQPGPPPQAWGPPPNYGPPPPHYNSPPPNMYNQPHQQQPHYERRDYNHEPGFGRARDNNNWNHNHNHNNGHHNRNRGRGRGGGNAQLPPPVDSGWPRRRDGQNQGGRW